MRRFFSLVALSVFFVLTLFININQIKASAGGLNTQRVSTTSVEGQGFNSVSFSSISDDGRYVGLGTNAVLDAGDTNNTSDMYVKDLLTRQISLVSISTGGVQGSSANSSPYLSGDGNWAFFASLSTNLVVGDTNGVSDVFVRDLINGITTRVSVDSLGNQATGGGSSSFGLSTDGRYLLFHSDATNLVSGDTNTYRDVFVHDRQTGTTTRVSVDSLGNQATGGQSTAQGISRDGRYVVYYSNATNLVTGDTNAQGDVFRFDRQTGTTIRISVADDESEATGGSSTSVAISDNGQYVAFRSTATNLVLNDLNAKADIFVRDVVNGTTKRVSVSSTGVEGDGTANSVSISADGCVVAFSSASTNMVAGDLNGTSDLFVNYCTDNRTIRVSTNANGDWTDGSTILGILSHDGFYVTYPSNASNLVTGDTNGIGDIFVTTLEMPSCSTITPSSEIVGTNNTNVTIVGGGYYNAPTVTFGAGVTVNSVTYSSATQLTADVSIDSGATLGSRDITITNPNGDAVTCSAAFTVNPIPSATPTPTSTATPTPTLTPTQAPTSTPGPEPTLPPLIANRLSAGFDANGECVMQKPGGKPEIFRIDMSDTKATLYIAPPSKPYTQFYITYKELGTVAQGDNSSLGSKLWALSSLLETLVYAESPEYAIDFSHTDDGGVVVYTINDLKPNTRYEFTIKCSNKCAFAETGNTLGSSTSTKGASSVKTYLASNITNRNTGVTDMSDLVTTGSPAVISIVVGLMLLVSGVGVFLLKPKNNIRKLYFKNTTNIQEKPRKLKIHM